jgi:hypothetical protein
MAKKYINNLETGHIELHFEKSDYMALSDAEKSEIKGAYLWSRSANAWVSRGTKDHYNALRVAEKLGFTEEEKQGERLSFAEEMEMKATKAECRADRFEYKAEKAVATAEHLQSSINSMRGDIAFFTQPNINTSAGRAFKNRRERMFAQYESGMEEYRKSEYYKNRAETARATADMKQLRDPVYLDNRIKECNSNIKKLQSNIVNCENKIYRIEQGEELKSYWTGEVLTLEKMQDILSEYLDKMEYEMDKLAYFENALDEIGKTRKLYSKDDIKPGYLIKVRGLWAKVTKANPKTVEGDYLLEHMKGCYCLYPYAEIQDMKIPEDWTEKSEETENSFNVGDIVARGWLGSDKIRIAYQVVKTTSKTITIQEIAVEDNKPIKDHFINEKQERKTVKQDRQ